MGVEIRGFYRRPQPVYDERQMAIINQMIKDSEHGCSRPVTKPEKGGIVEPCGRDTPEVMLFTAPAGYKLCGACYYLTIGDE